LGGLHIKPTHEAVIIIKTLINDTGGNGGIDEEIVEGDFHISCKQQSDAMTKREGCDEFYNVFKCGQKKHDAKQKQQMIITGQHMGCTQMDIIQKTTLIHADNIFRRYVMGECSR